MTTKNDTIETPVMGWHENIPAEVYHKWPGASSTRLNRLRATSPAHVYHEMMNPEDATPAKAVGQAVHDCILLPDEFSSRYFKMPECDRRTKEGKATYEAAMLTAGVRKTLKADDYQICSEILAAVQNHPMAALALYDGDGEYELSGVWIDPDAPCRCRMRADRFATINGYPVIVDVKTTESAAPEAFASSVIKYGYHRQAALYLHGAAALGREVDSFVLVAVEKAPPFGVCVYKIPDDLIALGWEQCKPLLETYHRCAITNQWPCYSEKILTLVAPKWAWFQDAD